MKSYLFVRYGGLSSVNQKGYTSQDAMFHAPSARRGIYAMPYDSQEMFLISPTTTRVRKSSRELPNTHHEYVKNSKGEPIKLTWNYHHNGVLESSNTSTEELKRLRHKTYDHNFKECQEDWGSRIFYKSYWKDEEKYDEESFLYGVLIKPMHPKVFKYSGNIWNHLNCYVNVKHCDVIKYKDDWILMPFDSWLKYYKYAKNNNDYKKFPKQRVCHNYTKDYFEVFIEKV
jgi:hypothetical protein